MIAFTPCFALCVHQSLALGQHSTYMSTPFATCFLTGENAITDALLGIGHDVLMLCDIDVYSAVFRSLAVCWA